MERLTSRFCMLATLVCLFADLAVLCAPLVLWPAPGHVFLSNDEGVPVTVLGIPPGLISIFISINFNELSTFITREFGFGESSATIMLPPMQPGSYVLHVAVLEEDSDELSDAVETYFAVATTDHKSRMWPSHKTTTELLPPEGRLVLARIPHILLAGGVNLHLQLFHSKEFARVNADTPRVASLRAWYCGVPGDVSFGAEWMLLGDRARECGCPPKHLIAAKKDANASDPECWLPPARVQQPWRPLTLIRAEISSEDRPAGGGAGNEILLALKGTGGRENVSLEWEPVSAGAFLFELVLEECPPLQDGPAQCPANIRAVEATIVSPSRAALDRRLRAMHVRVPLCNQTQLSALGSSLVDPSTSLL